MADMQERASANVLARLAALNAVDLIQSHENWRAPVLFDYGREMEIGLDIGGFIVYERVPFDAPTSEVDTAIRNIIRQAARRRKSARRLKAA